MQLFIHCIPCILICPRPLARDSNSLDIDIKWASFDSSPLHLQMIVNSSVVITMDQAITIVFCFVVAMPTWEKYILFQNDNGVNTEYPKGKSYTTTSYLIISFCILKEELEVWTNVQWLKGLRFSFQYIKGSSQSFVNPVSGDAMPISSIHVECTYTVHFHICRQNNQF